MNRRYPPAIRHPVFAIAGKYEVVFSQRPRRTYLRCLLTEERRPQREFALALQCRSLRINSAHNDEVFEQIPQTVTIDVIDKCRQL